MQEAITAKGYEVTILRKSGDSLEYISISFEIREENGRYYWFCEAAELKVLAIFETPKEAHQHFGDLIDRIMLLHIHMGVNPDYAQFIRALKLFKSF